MRNMGAMEDPRITSPAYKEAKNRCLECGKELTSFIAYIPSMGEACMECWVEAAKKDEENRSL